jgi:CubicO group peptidase (beta-lactamase class C family)
MNRLLSWAILLALTSATAAGAAPRTHFPQRAIELAEEQVVPELSWAYVVHGRVTTGTLVRTNGALRRAGRQLSFHAASVTKTVTASAVLSLVQAGTLALHASAFQYLGDLTVEDQRWRSVTIEQLLSHTSGLNDVGTGLLDHRNYPWREARAWLEESARITFGQDPGAGYSYSNLNYLLLGRIIENLTGETYGDFAARRILAPNGAPEARLSCFELLEAQVAVPHTLDGQGNVVPSQMQHLGRNHAASSGLCITARELAIWAANILDCRRPSPTLTCNLVASMLRPRMDNYGLGWEHSEISGHQVYGHSGADAGYAAALLIAPDRDISVAVLTNMTFSSASEMARILLARQLGSRIELRNPIPPRGSWPAFAGYFANSNTGCARVESSSEGLILIRQRLNFPYEVARTRLIPKPEWDDGYFMGVSGDSPVWFGAAPHGGLTDPEAVSLFLEHKRYIRTHNPERDCPDMR